MNYIGRNIKELREKENLSPESAAEKLGLAPEEFGKWENGEVRPEIADIEKAAVVFGADVKDVIYGIVETEKKRKAKRKKTSIILGAIAVLMITATEIMLPYLQAYVSATYDYIPAMIYGTVWLPAVYFISTLAVLSGASIIWDFRIQKKKTRLIVLWVSVGLTLLLGPLMIVNYMFLDAGSASFILSHAELFLIPAAGLHLGLKK